MSVHYPITQSGCLYSIYHHMKVSYFLIYLSSRKVSFTTTDSHDCDPSTSIALPQNRCPVNIC